MVVHRYRRCLRFDRYYSLLCWRRPSQRQGAPDLTVIFLDLAPLVLRL